MGRLDKMNEYLRRTWAEVDVEAIKNNFNEIKKNLNDNTNIMCVIKADGYGHGAVFLAKLYEKIGASCFAVSNIEEALQLRENNIRLPILILGFTPADMVKALSDNNITQAVFSMDYAEKLSYYAVKYNVSVKIHIKLDTGMSRIGFMYQKPERDEYSLTQIEKVCRLSGLEAEGIFTHFAVSDETDDGREATLKQFSCFSSAIEALKKRNVEFPITHCSNSGAIIDYSRFQLNCVRAGNILYGLSPSNKLKGRLNLKPAMQIKSIIAQIKNVEENSPVGYGCTYITNKPTKIATVPIGYADGYTRSLGNRAYMTVNGKKAPVIGRVCMDQVMLDITDIEKVNEGDEVTVIGNGENGSFSFDDMAAMTGTISYELICLVGKRVPRVYISNGKNVGIMDGICSAIN